MDCWWLSIERWVLGEAYRQLILIQKYFAELIKSLEMSTNNKFDQQRKNAELPIADILFYVNVHCTHDTTEKQ